MKLVSEPRVGIGAARNAALRAADGSHTPELEAGDAAALNVPSDPQPGMYIGAMRATIEAIGPWAEDVTVSDGLSSMLRMRELGIASAMLSDTVTLRRVRGEDQ